MREQQEHDSSGPRSSRSRPCNASVPINVPSACFEGQSDCPSPTVNPVPEQKPGKQLYTDKHETAALAIQQAFRIHRSLHAISTIASEFQQLKAAFVYPDVIDFQKPGSEEGHISVPATRLASQVADVDEVAEEERADSMEVDESLPKLAYTTVNYPVHSYVDATERLLMRLDGVDSWGDEDVREKRRSVVREIGGEVAKLERYWKQVWVDYVEKQHEQKQEQEQEQEQQEQEPKEVEEQVELPIEIEIDEEPVHVELPKVDSDDSDEWMDVVESEPDTVSLLDTEPDIEDGLRVSDLADEPIVRID